MIGRLDAPGAKLEPVMPGLENSRSPSVAPGLRRDFLARHDRHGRELVGDDRQRAMQRRRRHGDQRTRAGPARGRAIGLGAVTLICGSTVCAGAGARAAQRDEMPQRCFAAPAYRASYHI